MQRLALIVVVVAIIVAIAAVLYTQHMLRESGSAGLPPEVKGVLEGIKPSIHVVVEGAKNGKVPPMYTCYYPKPQEPRIVWDGVEGAKSYVVLVLDPDAPYGTFIHLVAYDGETPSWPAPGYKLGVNSAGEIGWYPVCPPRGDKPHRYYFIIIALDAKINLPNGATLNEVLSRVADHVIAYGYTVLTYAAR